MTSEKVEESIEMLEGMFEEEQNNADALPIPEPDKPRTSVREYPRYLVRWRIAIVYEGSCGGKTFYGRANDICMGGMSVLCDHNIFFENEVTLLLALPPLSPREKEKILEISSRMVYTVLSNQSFRVGLKFLSFKEGEKKLLENRLKLQNIF